MTEEFKAGQIAAYTEMQHYATSMIGSDPAQDQAWLDMALYASTSNDELENGLPEGLNEIRSAA